MDLNEFDKITSNENLVKFQELILDQEIHIEDILDQMISSNEIDIDKNDSIYEEIVTKYHVFDNNHKLVKEN
jgi:hypothetical protein